MSSTAGRLTRPELPKRHPDTFRFMVVISFAVHLVLLIAAATVPRIVHTSSQPILVTMVSLPAGGVGGAPKGRQQAAPKSVAPKAEPKAEAPAAEPPKLTYPDKTVKKAPPAKKPSGKGTETAKQPEAVPAGRLESRFEGSEFSTGIGGGPGGDGAGDGGLSNFPFAFYLLRIRDKISSNWFQSLVIGDVRGQFRVTVFFQILRDGRITNVQVEESSGISALDLSAQRAVYASNPMPALPQGYAEDILNVHFRFHYER